MKKRGYGLVSQHLWSKEIMVNLGPNHVLKCFQGGRGLRNRQICCEQKLCVFVGERVFLCGHQSLSLYSFLSCCLCHNLKWPLWGSLLCSSLQIHHHVYCTTTNCSSTRALASVWPQRTLAAFTWSLWFTNNQNKSWARTEKPHLNTSVRINWLIGGLNLFYNLCFRLLKLFTWGRRVTLLFVAYESFPPLFWVLHLSQENHLRLVCLLVLGR